MEIAMVIQIATAIHSAALAESPMCCRSMHRIVLVQEPHWASHPQAPYTSRGRDAPAATAWAMCESLRALHRQTYIESPERDLFSVYSNCDAFASAGMAYGRTFFEG
jgi:hypothetical protein